MKGEKTINVCFLKVQILLTFFFLSLNTELFPSFKNSQVAPLSASGHSSCWQTSVTSRHLQRPEVLF